MVIFIPLQVIGCACVCDVVPCRGRGRGGAMFLPIRSNQSFINKIQRKMKKTFKFMALLGVCGALLLTACGKKSPEWVDLGLPSGLLWATCNLGANSPEEYGDYYAWGETTTKPVYNWNIYKYCTAGAEGGLAMLTKYSTNSGHDFVGTPDDLTTLEAMDDAATQKFGDGARMPTVDEWQELIDNTTAEWTQVNGVNGRKFTAANGNSLFLPAAGCCYGLGLDAADEYGHYWSSSLIADGPNYAWHFYFSLDNWGVDGYHRADGLSVRAVRASQN